MNHLFSLCASCLSLVSLSSDLNGDYKMRIMIMFSYPHTFMLAILPEMLIASCPSGFSLVMTYLRNLLLSFLYFTATARCFFHIFLWYHLCLSLLIFIISSAFTSLSLPLDYEFLESRGGCLCVV